jgi:GntR family transcriptional repressor for pyruvate dehydrogenase complex
MSTPPLIPSPPLAPLTAHATASETLASLVPVARSTVVDAVSDRLRGEILAGRLPPGVKMPSERELAFALGVNRLTLRAALARLEALGLITTRHGSGTVVTDWRERAGLDTLATWIGCLRPEDPSWRELIVSLLEVRRILAAEAVGLAASRRTEADLDAMRSRAEEQHDRMRDPLAFARGDVAFVRAVVHASKNVGLEMLLNTFARFPDEHPELVHVLFDRIDASIGYYPIIIELVARGDSELARSVVRRELERVDEEWQLRHAPAAALGRAASNDGAPQPARSRRGPRVARPKGTTGIVPRPRPRT